MTTSIEPMYIANAIVHLLAIVSKENSNFLVIVLQCVLLNYLNE